MSVIINRHKGSFNNEFDADDAFSATVLRGVGRDFFCAGADLNSALGPVSRPWGKAGPFFFFIPSSVPWNRQNRGSFFRFLQKPTKFPQKKTEAGPVV